MSTLQIQDARIHYKCSFKISINDDTTSWHHVVITIRSWVSDIITKYEGDPNPIKQAGWYSGESWSLSNTKHLRVNTNRERGTSDEVDPEFWTMRLEHSDSKNAFRIWRTDIGLHKLSTNQYQFTIAISHYYKSSYMGDEMALPDPNVPRLVSSLLTDKRLLCTVGDQVVPHSETHLTEPGQGQQSVKYIFSSTRVLPFVLIFAVEDDRFAMSPNMTAKMLLGNAKVISIGNDAQEEVNYFLKEYAAGKHPMYTCKSGYVRVYFPMNKANVNDFKKHRYFLPEQIELVTPKENVWVIARSLVRRVLANTVSTVVTDFDVKNIIRERRLRQLRDQRNSENQDEYLTLLEEDNSSLTNQVARLEVLIKTASEELANYQVDSEIQIDEIDALTRRLKWEEDQRKKDIEELRADQTDGALAALSQEFQLFPSSLSNLISLAKLLYSKRVVFLESAVESSIKAEYKDLTSTWSLLRHINDTLHPLYFSESSIATIVTEFKSKTGIDLALTEGKMTKNDSNVMRQREFEYNGRMESFLPHLKLNKNGNHLRIHFYVDRANRKIVIGHCGDHLDTAGTRRLQ